MQRISSSYYWIVALALFCETHAQAQSPYEGGVKFYVHKTEQPGTVKLYRLLLADGTHCYTVSRSEVQSLTKSRRYRAKVEPMAAYVYTQQQPETTRLYRFSQLINGAWRSFYTAFGPEKQDVTKQRNSKLDRMRVYVYPSTYQPAEHSDIVPIYCCHSPVSGEHFYTTSEKERDEFIRVLKERR